MNDTLKWALGVVGSTITFIIGASWWAASNIVLAEDLEKSLKDFQVQESIRNDRLWIEILEQKKKSANLDESALQNIDRQLRITEESLIRNMQMEME